MISAVALTLLVMKTLEQIVKLFIVSAVQAMLDPLQFANMAGRGIKDAKLFLGADAVSRSNPLR